MNNGTFDILYRHLTSHTDGAKPVVSEVHAQHWFAEMRCPHDTQYKYVLRCHVPCEDRGLYFYHEALSLDDRLFDVDMPPVLEGLNEWLAQIGDGVNLAGIHAPEGMGNADWTQVRNR